MYIEQLDKSRLLINIEHEDLSIFELEPDKISMSNNETRNLFKQILALAAVKTGISLRDNTSSVDIMPYNNGCFILATFKAKQKRKIYKIKKTSSYILTKFKNAADMLDAVKMLYNNGFIEYGCNMYSGSIGYFLLLSSKAALPKIMRIMLSEYGTICPCDGLTAVRLGEVCTLICRNKTVEYLGKQL